MTSYFISSKKFTGFPCTHRQWRADSHCRFVHGYSREFYFEFKCHEMSREFWVMDFGGLKELKSWLEFMFDHTFLIAADDPYLGQFEKMDSDGIIQLRVLPNPGMEGTAQFVYEKAQEIVSRTTNNRVWITKVEVRENEKNSASFIP
jgi:6-pyruvoyltetrahydropterin/6-carboxytetrahydropterin synthase